MTVNEPRRDNAPPQQPFWSSRRLTRALVLAAAVLGLVYLFRDQALGEGAPLLLLLLVCVGMHFFMHRGHRGGSSGHKDGHE